MFSLLTQDQQPILCQAQAQAFEFLSHWHAQAPILHLWAGEGMGKTTVLQKLMHQTGGYWVDAKSLVIPHCGT